MARVKRVAERANDVTDTMIRVGTSAEGRGEAAQSMIVRSVRALLFVPPAAMLAFLTVPVLRESFVYVTGMCAATTLVLLLNFPGLVHAMFTRPIYFEDLEVEEAAAGDPRARTRYQRWFVTLLIPPLSVFSAMLCDYLFYRMHGSVLTPFEVAGVIGGALAGFYNVMYAVGSLLMYALQRRLRGAAPENRGPPADPTEGALPG